MSGHAETAGVLADNAHNSSPDRLAALDADAAAGLARRYARARKILLAAEHAAICAREERDET